MLVSLRRAVGGRAVPRLSRQLAQQRRILSTAVQVQRRDGTVAPINKLRGFIEYERNPEPYRPAAERLVDYEEINAKHEPLELKRQAARCMDCGTPFCQTHTGCPISNLIPEFNNLVFEEQWKEAYINLSSTNNFPEFTGRVCPAPCEGACVAGIVDNAITIKNMEHTIIEKAWEKGWVVPRPPALRSGKTVAVIGSGPGRQMDGVVFAMDFLTKNQQRLFADPKARGSSAQLVSKYDGSIIDATGKHVIVIGGGDTGTDCIATSLRHGCASLTNFELFPRPPDERASANPWPLWPRILRTDYGHEEAAYQFGSDPRAYSILSREFLGDEHGKVRAVKTVQVAVGPDGNFEEVEGSEKEWQADLVILAMGFRHPEPTVPEALRVALDGRNNCMANTSDYKTSVDGVFAAGDCRRGQSLVVWAINEGRGAAAAAHQYLMGPQ
jgi:NADPH-dependent glutamate synthase beta subunit-like oxidoreductase